MSAPLPVAAVVERLEALGSPANIARELLRARAFGSRGSAYSCPLAAYLTHFTADVVRVLKHEWETVHNGIVTERGTLPPRVLMFVQGFDVGQFGELYRAVPRFPE